MRVSLVVSIAAASVLQLSVTACQGQRAQAEQSALSSTPATTTANATGAFDADIRRNAERMIDEGRRVFRFDTFGDEAFWGDQLKLHRAIVGEKLGGVGPGLSPKMALSVGLKVDVDAVPAELAAQLKAGKVDLDAPASTV